MFIKYQPNYSEGENKINYIDNYKNILPRNKNAKYMFEKKPDFEILRINDILTKNNIEFNQVEKITKNNIKLKPKQKIITEKNDDFKTELCDEKLKEKIKDKNSVYNSQEIVKIMKYLDDNNEYYNISENTKNIIFNYLKYSKVNPVLLNPKILINRIYIDKFNYDFYYNDKMKILMYLVIPNEVLKEKNT